jgi:hypothetical protein
VTRRLFTILSSASLAIAAVDGMFWWASAPAQIIELVPADFSWGVTAGRGEIHVYWHGHGRTVSLFSTVVALLVLPAAGLAASILRPYRAARRERRQRCLAGEVCRCGYDLRASPGRCPECGAVPPAVPSEVTEG